MATNTRVLGDELKQFTIKTLNNLAREVDDQFGKWSKERSDLRSARLSWRAAWIR